MNVVDQILTRYSNFFMLAPHLFHYDTWGLIGRYR